MNAGQRSIGYWVPYAFSVTPTGYDSNMMGVLRRLTRQLPGDRYMFDEVVLFAYRYTVESAVDHFDLDSSEARSVCGFCGRLIEFKQEYCAECSEYMDNEDDA